MGNLEEALKKTGQWLNNTGPNADIAISSRVRLARNITGIRFSKYITKEDCDKVNNLVRNAVEKSGLMSGSEFYKIKDINPLDRKMLLERHLISKEFVSTPEGTLVLDNDQILSIMINEEDHLRIQCIESGLQLEKVYKKISQLDDELEKSIDYAFSPEFGFLTACPTNVGTGMRSSILMHLPALVLTKQINKVKTAIEHLGLTVRGYYGEGTESLGNFFQVSNQVTLGKTEEGIVDDIQKISLKIVNHEEEAREVLFKESKINLEDQIYRAYGVLINARILSSKEAMGLLSYLRLGINIGLITDMPIRSINEILILMQPAHLQKLYKRGLETTERDIIRAKLIRKKLQEKGGI